MKLIIGDINETTGRCEPVIKATTPEDRDWLIDRFRLFGKDAIEARARFVLDADEVYIHELASDKDAWYCIPVCLDLEFSLPYGIESSGFVEDVAFRQDRVGFMGAITSIHLEHGHICCETLVSSREWMGKSANERAFAIAERFAKNVFGVYKHEPEYIRAGNGRIVVNPEYGKYRPHVPGIPAFITDEAQKALAEHARGEFRQSPY